MIGILQYCRGYLRIRVRGFSPERFMNLCSNRDILLWNITREDGVYDMNISLRSFYKLRPIARKTGTRVAILERYGLPFLVPQLLRRKMFCAGLFLALGFWIWSSFYVWDIELTGNYQITEDIFEDFLEEAGVHVGMSKEDLDIGTLEKEIRRTFKQVTWTSARLSGTRLRIEIKENDAPILTEEQKKDGGSDLVAEYDGTIESMIVRNGVPKVSIGESVEKGTVLVEGSIPVYNDDATVKEYQYVRADADIMLLHERTYTARLPYSHIQKEYTGRTRTQRFLRFGNREIRLPQERPFLVYDTVVRESRPQFFEMLSIPVWIGRKTHREYLDVEYEYTLDEAESLLNEKIMTFLISLEEKGVQIIEKNVKIDTNGGTWVITGNFQVREPIGVSVDIRPPKDMGETGSDE